jgi:predicted phage terminase large subunit-like protein
MTMLNPPEEETPNAAAVLNGAPADAEALKERLQWSGEFAHELYQRNAVYLGKLSFQFFCWYYLRRHFDAGIAPFQTKLFKLLQELPPGRNAELLLPRGHGKSTMVSFALTVWHTCYRTKRHIGLISSTSDLAQKFLGKVSNELRNNELIKRDFGDLSGLDKTGDKEIWRQSKLRTSNQVVLFAMGNGGSVRGLNESLPENHLQDFMGRDRRGRPVYRNTGSFRPDLLIFDDVIEMKWLKTRKVRDQVEDWLFASALPALDAKRGNAIIVGTTLHGDDLVSRLWRDTVRTQAWTKLKLPACQGFDNRCNPIDPLWPGYWSQPDLNKPLDKHGRLLPMEEAEYRLKYQGGEGVYYLSHLWWKKVELGSKAFAQEYLLDPMADGLKLFDRAWMRYYITPRAMITAAQEQAIIEAGIRLDQLPDDLVAVTSVDPASGRGQRAVDNDSDYSVVSTIGYSPRRRRFYLLDVDRVRTTPAVLMQILLRHYKQFSNQYAEPNGWPCQHMGILVESVGYQKSLAIMLDELAVALGMFPQVIEVKRGRSDKKVRATSASPLVENGQVYWPCLLVENLKSDFETALDEIDRFPEGDHDDVVDSVVDCLNFLNRMSLSLNRGLPARSVMREMIRQSPELYAYVAEKERQGMDFQDAVSQYHERS